MSQHVTYLYGLARRGTVVPDNIEGIEAGAPIQLLDCDGLVAACSDVELDDFQSDRPSDPEWVFPRALRHERVIESVLAHGPVMPVRFGALFATRTALASWVVANGRAIKEFLDHVADKEEWSVKIGVESDGALEALIEQDPEWAGKVERLPAAPGARYFQEKKLRAEARQHVHLNARARANHLREALSEIAEERLLALRKAGDPGVEYIVNSAYLVSRDSVPSFLDVINETMTDTPWIRAELTGPWPPSHFCPRLTDGKSASPVTNVDEPA